MKEVLKKEARRRVGFRELKERKKKWPQHGNFFFFKNCAAKHKRRKVDLTATRIIFSGRCASPPLSSCFIFDFSKEEGGGTLMGFKDAML